MLQKEYMQNLINSIETNPYLWENIKFVKTLCSYSTLPYDFIQKYYDKVNWTCICTYKHLSNTFMKKWKDKINFSAISCSQRLTEDFIEEFSDKLDWYGICRWQEMSQDFILNHLEHIDWYMLFSNKKFKPSESFWRTVFILCPDFQIEKCNLIFTKNFIREWRNKFIVLYGKNINSYHKRLWKEFGIESWEN